MNMKALLGAVLALVLSVGGAAFLVAHFARPSAEAPPPETKVDESAGPKGPDEVYLSNPFEPITAGPKSKVVVEETRLDFGAMALGTSKSHDFVFKNTGEGPLRLAKGHLMCKCAIPVVPDQQIQPGESISIKLTWTPVDATHDFSKEAVIWTNDPENPKIILAIRGEVNDDPIVNPGGFYVGEVSWSKETEHQIQLVSTISQDLKIISATASHPDWMNVTWEPVDVRDLNQPGVTRSKPVSGYVLKLKIMPDKSVGPFSGWITLKTNLKENELRVNVMGVRTGPITMHGGDYHAGLSMADLKRFKSADGKVTNLFMYLEPFEQDLQLTEVISESQNLTATLTKQSKAPGSKKDFYILAIRATKGISPGTVFTSEIPDHLTLKINHPTVPVLQLSVRYVVH